MKRVLFLAVLLAISIKNNAQAKKQTIPSTINKVTVFTQGAQVERSATVAVPQGNSQIVISELSPDLEEKSIQVNLPADFTLLSVTRQVNNLRLQAHLEETEALAAEQKKLEQQLAKEKNNETVYNEEKAMLGKNQVVTGDNGLKAADLKEALDLQRSRLSEVMAKLLEIKNNQTELTEQIEKINRQLGRFSAHNLPPTSDIILNVQTKNPASGKLTLTYMVKNAGWIPAYDIRVKDINNPINLVYKANVFQTCGEEWKNVKLALSSGSPEESNTKPTLSPWYLRNFRSVDDLNMALRSQVAVNGEVSGVVTDGTTSQPMPGVTVRVKGRTIGTTTDAQGRFKLQQPAGNNLLEFSYIGYERQELSPASAAFVYMIPITTSLNETVVVSNGITNELQGKVAGITSSSQRAIAKKVVSNKVVDITEQYTPTTFVFDIPIPYTILPDGKSNVVGVKELEIPATYQYYAVPKLEKAAFLTAAFTDWESLNLLDGEASIFYEGTYIGKTLLDLQAVSDTLQLSLGKDKQVVVNRTMQKDESRKNLLGSRVTFSRTWEITVKNNKGVPIKVNVEDQLPIKTISDMDISKTEYGDAALDAETNILTWQLHVAPATEQKRQLKYAITYPKGQIVNVN